MASDPEQAGSPSPEGGDAGTARVLVVLPYEMSARNVLRTPIAEHLCAHPDLKLTFVSRDAADMQPLAARSARAGWRPMIRPFRTREGLRRLISDARFALGFYLHMAVTYRFNALRGFKGFSDRLRQSPALRRPGLREGLPLFPVFGFPLPRSQAIYRALERLNRSGWRRHVEAERLMAEAKPDLVVLTHLQTSLVTPYFLAARRRNVRIVGMIGSWDQPTTKGPLLPDIGRVLVQSRQVKSDLERFHAVPSAAIDVVGWPQMDICRQPSAMRRAQVLDRLGLPADYRFILLGAYSERLGRHEPDLCRRIVADIAAGEFGERIALVVRAHPLDAGWHDRLMPLSDPPRCVVQAPDLGNLDLLAAMLREAEVVLSSAGTISLDAVAVDTAAIALAFEDESLPYYDRPARRFDMEHYAAVMATGGVAMARDEAELKRLLKLYLGDPTADAEARRTLREAHLEPLDGEVSRRIAAIIADEARQAARARTGRA